MTVCPLPFSYWTDSLNSASALIQFKNWTSKQKMWPWLTRLIASNETLNQWSMFCSENTSWSEFCLFSKLRVFKLGRWGRGRQLSATYPFLLALWRFQCLEKKHRRASTILQKRSLTVWIAEYWSSLTMASQLLLQSDHFWSWLWLYQKHYEVLVVERSSGALRVLEATL